MHKLAKSLGKQAYVVKQAKIDETNNCQVLIVARKPGFWSWVLSLLGVDSTFTMRVYRDRLESEEGSLSGRMRTVIPLAALDTYTCGFLKPAILVFMGFAAIGGGIGMAAADAPGFPVTIAFLAGIGCFVKYFFFKCLVLDFTTIGANGIYFLFKRSVIEGINVDEKFAATIGELVKKNYLEQVVGSKV